MRKDMGLYKRTEGASVEAVEEAIRQALSYEYDQGHIEDYGRSYVYQYMRTKYNLIGR